MTPNCEYQSSTDAIIRKTRLIGRGRWRMEVDRWSHRTELNMLTNMQQFFMKLQMFIRLHRISNITIDKTQFKVCLLQEHILSMQSGAFNTFSSSLHRTFTNQLFTQQTLSPHLSVTFFLVVCAINLQQNLKNKATESKWFRSVCLPFSCSDQVAWIRRKKCL